MLKLMLFAFLACGVVSAASAMSVWIVEPGIATISEPLFTANDFNHAFLLSVALITGLLSGIYSAVRD
jgi:hypothetical protein